MQVNHHLPVLLVEAVDALAIKSEGVYVDCTFGRGGHSREILRRLGANGQLIAIDKDLTALRSEACQDLSADSRFSIEHGSFTGLKSIVTQRQLLGQIDGVLMDLGVSSPQLDDPQRGFSFMQDGPLDLRMNQEAGESAAQWLAKVSEKELASVLRDLGEERFAGRIARVIVEQRAETPLLTTGQLVSLISGVVPMKERNKHPATRSFLAIRLHINSELSDLEQCLPQVVEVLKPSGRLSAIAFHSLEDRVVKRFIRDMSRPAERGLMGNEPEKNPPKLKKVGGFIRASAAELQVNPRARSAVLRVAERTNVCV